MNHIVAVLWRSPLSLPHAPFPTLKKEKKIPSLFHLVCENLYVKISSRYGFQDPDNLQLRARGNEFSNLTHRKGDLADNRFKEEFLSGMVTMSTISPLASLCVRRSSKSCSKHGTNLLSTHCSSHLSPGASLNSAKPSGCHADVICKLPRFLPAPKFWSNYELETVGIIMRQRQQEKWVRTWAGRNLAETWNEKQSPYDTLGIERDAGDDAIKQAYRRMAKQFHPDVYDESSGQLQEGETAESFFIQIQAAYELLMDRDQRRQYDLDHKYNPLKASSAWMDWVIKKRRSFDQRGEMAASAWAEQQMLNMNLRARRAARDKVDPEEERRILAREKAASVANFENTIRRQSLVLKKRDIMNKKAREEAQKKLVQQLLEAEGLELDDDRF